MNNEHRNEDDHAEALAELKAEMRASKALKQSVSTEELEAAIVVVTDCLRTGWTTGVGRRLQQFIWSLWNQHHWINLYDLTSYTDTKLSKAMIVIFGAAMCDVLTEQQKRKILTDSGEFARWEKASTTTPEDEDVIYPPLPMSAETLMSLAISAQKSAKRLEMNERGDNDIR
jgi:hypothetical protein